MNEDDVLSERQTSSLLLVQPSTLQAWRTKGRGPKYLKIGKLVRYRLRDLHSFLDQQTRTSTVDPGVSQSDKRTVRHTSPPQGR